MPDDFVPAPFDSWNAKRDIDDERRRRGQEARERRRRSDDHQWAALLVKNLRYALHDIDLSEETRGLLTQVFAEDIAEAVFQLVWARVAERIRDGNILVQKRSVGPDYQVLSFSSMHPKWEEKIAEWLVNLLGPHFEKYFVLKKTRSK